jgi:hypothetical protein
MLKANTPFVISITINFTKATLQPAQWSFFYHYLSSFTDVYWKNNLNILMLCAASYIQIFQLRISNDGEVNLMQTSKLPAVSGDVRLK